MADTRVGGGLGGDGILSDSHTIFSCGGVNGVCSSVVGAATVFSGDMVMLFVVVMW